MSRFLFCFCFLTTLIYAVEPVPSTLPYYTQEGYGFFLEGGLLIWHPAADGLSYAIKNDTSTGSITDGKVKDSDPGWDVGGKLGLGYQVADDWMDLFLNWTHFKTSSTDRTRASNTQTGVVFSIWTSPVASLTPAESAQATWKVSLNSLDFEIGGKFTPRSWLLIRPHFGMRAAWIDQRFDVTMKGGTSLGPPVTVESDRIDMDNDYWGVGPRFGLQSTWGLMWGFSLFGNTALSLLYGEFDLHQNETVTFEGVQPPTVYLNTNESFYMGRSCLELIVGVRWDTMLSNDQYHLGFQVGWEQVYYWGQIQLRMFTDDINPGASFTRNGDLSFQGVTLTGRFDF